MKIRISDFVICFFLFCGLPFAALSAQMFGTAVKYYAGNTPKLVLVRDFNNDSRKDLAILASHTVRILNQQSNGSFVQGVNLTGFNNLSTMAADDFDNDNDIDLVLGDQSDNTLMVYRNNITNFYPGQVISCAQPYDMYCSSVLDDAAHLPGLLVAGISTDHVYFYRCNGIGQFNYISEAYAMSPWKLIYENAISKLIVLSWDVDSTWWFGWNSDIPDFTHVWGKFYSRGLIRSGVSGEFINSVGAGPDLALVCRSDSTIKIFERMTFGEYYYTYSIEWPDFVPYEIATGDFDNDGDNDLAAIDNRTDGKLWLGIKSGSNIIGSLIDHIGANPRDIKVSDIDNDGNVDLVVTFTGDDSVGIFFNHTGGSDCSYVVGDVNGSGNLTGLDVVYAVAYLKGGPAPTYSCECTPGHTWYVVGDVNASCTFTGLDVTYMVAFLKGGPGCHPCPDCAP